MNFPIKKIYIDEKVKNFELTKKIIKNTSFPHEIINIEDINDCTIKEGKQTLLITSQKGKLVKPCPGTQSPYICCRYFVINALTQCPMDCSYCILQKYLSSPIITMYADIDSIFDEVNELLNKQPKHFFRIGTGELADSLALDPVSSISEKFITFFSKKKNVLFELKTKTDNISTVLKNQASNIVISWSLNPQKIINKHESGAVSVKRRLIAAKKCQKKGFFIGFHFDPIIFHQNWENNYKNLIKQIFTYIDLNRVVWISLGSFRFPPDLKKIIQLRFPDNSIIYDEMVLCSDGKMRYLRPLRIQMYKLIYDLLKEKAPDLFIYFCMESPAVWDRVMEYHPATSFELDYLFAESIYRRFPDLNMNKPAIEVYQD